MKTKTTLVFLVTACLLAMSLVGTALIPREAIRDRMKVSAEFLCEGKQFEPFVEHVNSTRIDRYADAMLLGIAWAYDEHDPIRSVLVSRYYENELQNASQNLLDAVTQDLPANQQYLRYWHGSAGIVRALMTFLTLPQIYVWHGVILTLLAAGVLLRLALRKDWMMLIGMGTGLIGTAFWLVPLSLEFTWVFLILLTQIHLVLTQRWLREWRMRQLVFLVSGMVLCFLDFLTCETLTLLVPLLFLLRRDEQEGLPSVKTLLKAAGYWAIGYSGMYLLKWGLAGIVMGENPLPYVAAHVGERLAGSVGELSFFQLIIGALIRNVTSLFPLDYDLAGALIGITLAISAGYIGYVHHRKDYDKRRVTIYAALGMVPYVRYLVLVNHSYLHSFFTYRAQFATLLALVMILSDLTGWGRMTHGKT